MDEFGLFRLLYFGYGQNALGDGPGLRRQFRARDKYLELLAYK